MILSGNFGIKAESFSWGLTSRLCKEGLDVHAQLPMATCQNKISTFESEAIYITPNGFTSVYCHLQKTTDAINDYIQKSHYKEHSFEIELFLNLMNCQCKGRRSSFW
jgi:hypothetical protein